MTTLQGYVHAWQESAADVCDATDGLSAAQWAGETACPGWSVHDVLAHLVCLEEQLAGIGEPAERATGPVLSEDLTRHGVLSRRGVPSAALREHLTSAVHQRTEQLATLVASADDDGQPDRTPFGLPWTWRALLRSRSLDMWVHSQDIRRALRLPGGLPSLGARATVSDLVETLPYVLGAVVRPDPGTTVVWEVGDPYPESVAVRMGQHGRAERLDDAPEHPDLRVSIGAAHLVQLSCGRRPPTTLALTLRGDIGLAAAVLAAMVVTP